MNGIMVKEHHYLYAYETKAASLFFLPIANVVKKMVVPLCSFIDLKDGGAQWILRYLIHG